MLVFRPHGVYKFLRNHGCVVNKRLVITLIFPLTRCDSLLCHAQRCTRLRVPQCLLVVFDHVNANSNFNLTLCPLAFGSIGTNQLDKEYPCCLVCPLKCVFVLKISPLLHLLFWKIDLGRHMMCFQRRFNHVICRRARQQAKRSGSHARVVPTGQQEERDTPTAGSTFSQVNPILLQTPEPRCHVYSRIFSDLGKKSKPFSSASKRFMRS